MSGVTRNGRRRRGLGVRRASEGDAGERRRLGADSLGFRGSRPGAGPGVYSHPFTPIRGDSGQRRVRRRVRRRRRIPRTGRAPDVPEPFLGAHRSPVHGADSRASRTPDPRPRVERRGSRQVVGPERRRSPAAIVGVRIAVLGGAGKGCRPGVVAIRAGFVARASRGGDSAPRRRLPRRALTPR